MSTQRKDLKNEEITTILKWYTDNDIISIDDVLNLGKEESMNRVLQKFHKYDIYQGNDGKWRTNVYDETQPEKRRRIVRKNKQDLIRYLLEYYQCEPYHTMQSLWVEFETYRSSLQKANTIKGSV